MMSASLLVSLLAIGAAPADKALGINLDFHVSWAPHWMFVDGMKRARPWVPFVPDSDVWHSGATIPLDEQGMPKRVPFVPPEGGPPQHVRTVLFDELDGRFPAGKYVLEFQGSGVLEVEGDTPNRVIRAPGRHVLDVTPTNRGIWFIIRRSDPKDHIRNMKLWLPGFENAKDPIHPEMAARLKGFAVLRPNQTMSTNGGDYPCDNQVAAHDPACVQRGATRPKPSYFTQATSRGVAIEYLADLANRAGADLWPGIPHAVDDAWVRDLATVLRDRLDRKRKVYIELSNEIWNFSGHYPQHDYFIALGRKHRTFSKDMPKDPTDAGRRAYLRRALQVWKVFEDVFGPGAKSRIVKVVPGFFGIPWASERMLSHLEDRTLNPRGVKADALAVGAYFGGTVADALVEEGRAKSAGIDEVLDRAADSLGNIEDSEEAPTFAGLTRAHVTVARKYGVPLIAYEGGQHLALSSMQPSPLNAVIQAANDHPRMGQLYEKMLDIWFGLGGGLFVAYSFVSKYSEYGTFGHLQSMTQPDHTSPKLQALRNRMVAFGADLAPPLLAPPFGRRWAHVLTGGFPPGIVLVPLVPAP